MPRLNIAYKPYWSCAIAANSAFTQTTMELSRDDYTKFQKEYEKEKIFRADSFAVIDQEGVGKLVEMAVKLGRGARKDLEVGICGEHGGEPSSVQFCYRVGMNYV